MTVHANSLAAYDTLDLSEREALVMSCFHGAIQPMTDREVMERLGFTDPNAVRPRITKLVAIGLLEECGNVKDSTTGKTVRICRTAGAALQAVRR